MTEKEYNVSVSIWDFYKGEIGTKHLLTIKGKSVADVRRKVLKEHKEVGTNFTIYDPSEFTTDPVTVKWKGKTVILGVDKGKCYIYDNGIFWFTYNKKTKVFRKYKIRQDGTLSGMRKW